MQPIFAYFTFGDTEQLLVFDVRSYEDSVYNRIYFDANRNDDLTDDPPIDGTMTPLTDNPDLCRMAFETRVGNYCGRWY